MRMKILKYIFYFITYGLILLFLISSILLVGFYYIMHDNSSLTIYEQLLPVACGFLGVVTLYLTMVLIQFIDKLNEKKVNK